MWIMSNHAYNNSMKVMEYLFVEVVPLFGIRIGSFFKSIIV